MKNKLKIVSYLIGILLAIIIALLSYVKFKLPNVGDAPNLKVELSTQNIERGKYLANHVMVCIDCHSTRDWSLYSGPIVKGTEGKGGESFDQRFGFPGKYVSKNLTPFHLKNWTDGEIFRAITTGVSKDGNALFPIMPFHNYGQLDENDINAVIAFIRTLPSVPFDVEPSSSDFPINFIINTKTQKAKFTTIPNKLNTLEYGKYLVTAANCYDCHTKQEKGKFVGEAFAGGMAFKLSDKLTLRSANITSDKESGIGNWSKELFIQKFKQYEDSSFVLPKANLNELQTVMPWTMYAGMTVDDLSAIYTYLQSTKAVKNKVEHFSTHP